MCSAGSAPGASEAERGATRQRLPRTPEGLRAGEDPSPSVDTQAREPVSSLLSVCPVSVTLTRATCFLRLLSQTSALSTPPTQTPPGWPLTWAPHGPVSGHMKPTIVGRKPRKLGAPTPTWRQQGGAGGAQLCRPLSPLGPVGPQCTLPSCPTRVCGPHSKNEIRSMFTSA